MTTIKVRGFLARESDWGCGDSYANLRAHIEAAMRLDEPILLDFDSGGGDAIGVRDLAEFIFANRDRISGYVSGICGSAAYYLAAATGNLTAAEDAIIGSIGAMMFPPFRGDAIVSGLSKDKNTEAGIQAIVDESCIRFLNDVARYRGLSGSPEELSKSVGEGALFSASRAKEMNLIDGVRTMDDKQDQNQLDLAGIAALMPKILEKLDELAKKVDSVDERVGILERDERISREEDGEQAACKPKAEAEAPDGEEKPAEEEKKKEENQQDERMQTVVDCMFGMLKKQGKIPPKEESMAIRLLNKDPDLFKAIYVDREAMPIAPRESISQKAGSEPVGKTRSERARQYMKIAGCDYITALAHEMEKGE